ncbi:MAG: diaminopimelate epimerase [Alphaproteobacteria bacterium]|nr:diaminopimelate epimerase [Alphaproteobacteria bacterium]
MKQHFIKMHGLGNDFVVLDARHAPVALSAAQIRAIADRRFGVGCDQLITVEPSARAEAFMRIHNADGGEVEACGNATRCVARWLMREKQAEEVAIETSAGVLVSRDAGEGLVAVDMGIPRLDWREIPLARQMDTLHLDFALGPLRDPVAVNIGNPHVVFFVPDAEEVALGELGPKIEHDPLFPARVNVSVAELTGPARIRLRVWERGVGITKACGTAACATLVAARRRALVQGETEIRLDGGTLRLDWRKDGHVVMTGPTAESFRGEIDPSLLGG